MSHSESAQGNRSACSLSLSGLLSTFLEDWRSRRRRKDIYWRREYWDKRAAQRRDFSASLWRNPWLNELYHLEHTRVIKRLIPNLRGLNVVDLGCGVGRLSSWLADEGAQVFGIDFSMLALRQALSACEGKDIRFLCASIFNLPLLQESVELVISVGCLAVACRSEDEIGEALREVWRIVKPGGQLLVMEPFHQGFLSRVIDIDVKAFVHQLQHLGFEATHRFCIHFWPVRLLLAPIPWPRWVTVPLVHYGEAFLTWGMRNRCLGDYHVVLARKE